MEFKYKTQSELAKMTPEELDQYATDKSEFEQKQSDEKIKTALDQFKKDLEAEAKTGKEAAEKEINQLKADLEAQGKQINKLMERGPEGNVNESIDKSFLDVYKQHTNEGEDLQSNKQLKITVKDVASSDVMSVNTVSSSDFPADGTTGVVTSGMYGMWAKFLGFFGILPNKSKIMDLISIEPLTEASIYAINTTVIGTAEITTECKLKPVVKLEFEDQKADAEPVAAMWFTTTKLRRFFKNLAFKFRETFGMLVTNKIPEAALTAIRNGASAFTPNPLFNINANPDNYEALGAAIASIQMAGGSVNGIILSPIAYRNMKQSKNANGTYNLSNGGSITIVDGGIGWNGVNLPVVLDETLGADEFIVGDFSIVKGGVDTELIYMETDGRVDAGTSATTGLGRNIRTHVIEQFCAFLVPKAVKSHLVRDTFANVKTLITPGE
ncbi:hypothetical protein K5I29_04190 [Flavobacterium agricola]|uniref:HK97 family phage major capsid protein n=1 Tax=Flavobacterium agricola TaxID=2870839 RepID=A0ABY6M0M2_9FLAO|nr:hypothetical protein [Flavobacterium agricola]UYW02107.1 hypothetical protein K5I29_04190 [Flavobacterium agricola]